MKMRVREWEQEDRISISNKVCGGSWVLCGRRRVTKLCEFINCKSSE